MNCDLGENKNEGQNVSQRKDVVLNRVLFGAQCESGKLNRDMVFVDNLKPVREPGRGAKPAHIA